MASYTFKQCFEVREQVIFLIFVKKKKKIPLFIHFKKVYKLSSS